MAAPSVAAPGGGKKWKEDFCNEWKKDWKESNKCWPSKWDNDDDCGPWGKKGWQDDDDKDCKEKDKDKGKDKDKDKDKDSDKCKDIDKDKDKCKGKCKDKDKCKDKCKDKDKDKEKDKNDCKTCNYKIKTYDYGCGCVGARLEVNLNKAQCCLTVNITANKPIVETYYYLGTSPLAEGFAAPSPPFFSGCTLLIQYFDRVDFTGNNQQCIPLPPSPALKGQSYDIQGVAAFAPLLGPEPADLTQQILALTQAVHVVFE